MTLGRSEGAKRLERICPIVGRRRPAPDGFLELRLRGLENSLKTSDAQRKSRKFASSLQPDR
jgi:hypothetical protein